MSEDAYMIARVVAVVGILILVLPALFRRGISFPTFIRFAALWAVIIAGIIVVYEIMNR